MTTPFQGLSAEYREKLREKLGDASAEYMVMLERLIEVGATWTDETRNEVEEKMSVIAEEITQYVAQFGFIFFVAILRHEDGKQQLRVGLLDKTSNQLPQ